MLKKSIVDALNRQVNREFYSAYLYLAMSAYCESANMKGFAKWLNVQAKEEQSHGNKIYDYILAAGGTVHLAAIEAPQQSWPSMLALFEEVYAHEQKVSGMIHDLIVTARKETDFATEDLLMWFAKEQVEEEANALEIVEKIKALGDITGHLFWMDHQMGKRE
ncbi:MAG: ferritin [Methanomicrobiales archaeon]|nr:ferritin [Methanomicrobiales archaeon]